MAGPQADHEPRRRGAPVSPSPLTPEKHSSISATPCCARPWRWKRLTESTHGQLVYELPHPRRDGSTHRWLDPLERIEKLAVLVPAARFHLLRLVLAPHAAWRSQSVPGPPDDVEHDAGAGGPSEVPVAVAGSPPPSRSAGRAGSALLKRVFAIDVVLGPRCGGRRRIVAVYPGGEGLRSNTRSLLPEW